MFPYGINSRATGYYGICDDIDGSNTFNVWCIESKEILAVCIENTSGNESGFGFIAGALARPATTGSNDVDVDDRLYGAITFGTDFGPEIWENLTTGFSDTTSTSVNNYKAVIFDPASNVTGSTCQLLSATRCETFTDSTSTRLVTGDGAFVGIPINYYSSDTKASGAMTPDRFVGTMRQIRIIRDFPARVIIQDGSGTTVGFAWGSHPSTYFDSAGFTNS